MRTLRRPMFGGGSTGTGITSGLAPRQGYADNAGQVKQVGDIRGMTIPQLKELAGTMAYRPRGTNVYDFLTEFGLNIASTPPQGNIIQTAAAAAKEPHQRFLAKKGEAEAAGYVSEADMFKTLIGAQADILGGEGAGTYAATEIAKRVRTLTEKIMDANAKIQELESAADVTGAPVHGGTGINQARIDVLNKQIQLDRTEINNLKKTSPHVTALLKLESFTQPLLDNITERLKRKKDASGNLVYPPTPEGQEKLLMDAGRELKSALENMAEGGRVGYQGGGAEGVVSTGGYDTTGRPGYDMEGGFQPSNIPGMPEELGDISYEELRARLPQEVSDEIIRLLANSPEALEDFAVIQTEQDIANFNKKYGVNLVLPAEG